VKVLYVVSDQKENATAIKGVSEADLCAPIGRAAVAATHALGHEAKYFDPKKSYSIKPALIWAPEVSILIHVNATGDQKPQGVMGWSAFTRPVVPPGPTKSSRRWPPAWVGRCGHFYRREAPGLLLLLLRGHA